MSDFPQVDFYNNHVINTLSPEAIGVDCVGMSLGFTSAVAWPSANLAFFIPFRVKHTFTVVKMSWINGTVATDNVDVGVYDQSGNLLVSSGSTATSGINAIQTVDITDTTLLPGLYYMAMARNGTTNTNKANNTSSILSRGIGVLSMATAFPLPNPATMVGSTTAYIPFIALHSRTLV